MTRVEFIKSLFKQGIQLSCQDVCRLVMQHEEYSNSLHEWRYLSGSISSSLRKMVKSNYLEYRNIKTSRGGHIYRKRLTAPI